MWRNSRERYAAYCLKHQDSLPVFFQPWWLDAACGADKWMALVDGEKEQIWPLFQKTKWGLTYTTMPPLTLRLGFWPPGESPEWKGFPAPAYSLHNLQEGANSDCFAALNGIRRQSFQFYRIPGDQPVEAVWRSMNELARRQIRKGESALRLEKGGSADMLYRLFAQRLERQGLKPSFSAARLAEMVESARRHAMGDVWTALSPTGVPAAVIFQLWDKQFSYYLAGGMAESGAKTGASRWLLWQAVQAALQEGRGFDFGGGMIPAVAEVYASLGGQPGNYWRIQQYRPAWIAYFVRALKNIHASNDRRFH